ncbi:MAG: hypothetical protein FJX74_08505 [Armatimonadetes bacterium]|nr:hypothetical protein [Armatimonadota bacterium]
MGEQVTVLCGPSGSGKTTAALERYAARVREGGEDTGLLVLPTARAVREARERLVNEGRAPGLLDPRIFTFPQLAQLILNANHECATAIGAGARRLLLGQIIADLAARDGLTELAAVSRLPGFVVALGELIADLKRAAVRPEQFAAALSEAGLERPAHRELAALYAAYQGRLTELGSYDEEGLFWLARDVLRAGRRRPLERIGEMIVDGFTDFTTTQLGMLAVLVERIPHGLITLDYSPDDEREGLAPWFEDTRKRLQQFLNGVAVEHLPPGVQSGPLAHLRAQLFRPGAGPKVSAEGRLHLLTCPGRERETREVLARVKGLLSAGRARPGDVAVIARDLPDRAQEIEQAARRMGVPVHVECSRSPTDAPTVRAVLHAYETVIEGYRREDVLALLRSTCFTFEAPASRNIGPEDVAWSAEKALVVEGRRQWRERLPRLARRLARSRREDEAARAPRVEAAASALEEVFALLPDPRRTGTAGERVAELREFIARTGLWENAARGDLAEDASANLRALEQLEGALDELEHMGPGGAAGEGLSVAGFQRLLRDLLSDRAATPRSPAGERVSVLPPDRARQARFAHTFVLGLSEGAFPRRPREEPFFSAVELARLEAAGVALERRRGPEAREPLLFHAAIASAEQELWLARPSAELDGRPLEPSHYLREVRRLFHDETLDAIEVPFSEVVPPAEAVATLEELTVRAMLDLGAPPPNGSVVAHNALVASEPGPQLLRRLVQAVSLEELRDSRAPTGAYVGEFSNAAAVADLAGALGPDHRFSPTDLAVYAACPFAYFCQVVLRLAEPEYARPAVDPRVAGEVRHDILATFTARRAEGRPGEALIAPGEEDSAFAQLEAIIEEAFESARRRGAVADESLWELEQARCRRELREWVFSESETFAGEAPLRVELRFGQENEPPVAVPGRRDILFTGRVDRVNGGAGSYSLVDYKSGALPRPKDVATGVDLQFPIYALGVEQTVPELAGARCIGWHYCGLRRPLKQVSLTGADDIERLRAQIEDQIVRQVEAARAGRFAYATIEECLRHCAAGRICRHQPRRREPGSDQAEDDESA